MSEGSTWSTAAQVYVQPNDYLLVDLGAVAYEGRTSYTGSMVSLGSEYLQLDLGFRPHWLSPMSDSSMLMSTESPTMPSWTVSNCEPFSPLGITYQVFEAKMSKSDNIVWQDGFTSGHPLLCGAQLTMEPASGWSLSLNRLAQFGGGARGNGSFGQLIKGTDRPVPLFQHDERKPRPGLRGPQWRDVLPHVDLGLDLRYYDSLASDHVLPTDPHSTRPDSFYDVSGGALSLTKLLKRGASRASRQPW
jgi:Capsule assembly protein Wzi